MTERETTQLIVARDELKGVDHVVARDESHRIEVERSHAPRARKTGKRVDGVMW